MTVLAAIALAAGGLSALRYMFALPRLSHWLRHGRVRAIPKGPTQPISLLKPLSLWELGVSRFGVFPEMQTFGFRLMRRWREIQKRYRFDVVFDNQCLSWGLLGIQAMGVPVVSPSKTPLRISGRSGSLRCVTIADCPGRRRSRSGCRSSSLSGTPGGQPSTITTLPAP